MDITLRSGCDIEKRESRKARDNNCTQDTCISDKDRVCSEKFFANVLEERDPVNLTGYVWCNITLQFD